MLQRLNSATYRNEIEEFILTLIDGLNEEISELKKNILKVEKEVLAIKKIGNQVHIDSFSVN